MVRSIFVYREMFVFREAVFVFGLGEKSREGRSGERPAARLSQAVRQLDGSIRRQANFRQSRFVSSAACRAIYAPARYIV